MKARDRISVAVMLFGMLFGAGNLIFPVHLGQLAAGNVWVATLGFVITAVGLPLLGVAALGASRASGGLELAQKVGGTWGIAFMSVLYLTIGPFFAIPRCASVTYTVGIEPLVGSSWLPACTVVFFAIAVLLAMRPGQILTWIGKVITPLFLVFLAVLLITALVNPLSSVDAAAASANYQTNAFSNGFFEGYNTMDVLAALAFGGVVVDVIRRLGVSDGGAVAGEVVRCGAVSCAIMVVIYGALALVGAQSVGALGVSENGGIALTQIATAYFGPAGLVILAVTVALACLKVAVGLLVSCAEFFREVLPKGPSYRVWVLLFAVFSLIIANAGLTRVIEYAVPVLMFLYPLAIVLIGLALAGRWVSVPRQVYVAVVACVTVTCVLDFLNGLPEVARAPFEGLLAGASAYVPLFDMGLSWLLPAVLGVAIGLAAHAVATRKAA
ncbi:branched-chain amino acid transport system II carrier protein [Denitrobacterium detoxificans]|uniref:branched-chain amino acid transport system II carrier protein n=1 Tax=Denitrobacterium detoxificans TaxID=79604 RepID=UPI0026EB2B5A|nr:branched-chain amino acid transport system II carrier protein [Denitrobacterium detoxificans]